MKDVQGAAEVWWGLLANAGLLSCCAYVVSRNSRVV
jgi:hypothetical protein